MPELNVNVEKHLKKRGLASGGLWEGLNMPELRITFECIDEKIVQILLESGFEEKNRFSAYGRTIVIYSGKDDAFAIISDSEKNGGIWRKYKLNGFGPREAIYPVFDAIQKLYEEKEIYFEREDGTA